MDYPHLCAPESSTLVLFLFRPVIRFGRPPVDAICARGTSLQPFYQGRYSQKVHPQVMAALSLQYLLRECSCVQHGAIQKEGMAREHSNT